MPTTICKSFDFDAAHSLPMMPDGHKCKRKHGHTYRVEIMLRAEVDAAMMVVDYEKIAEAWAPIHAKLDHRDLDTVAGLQGYPTTELLAWYIMRDLRKTDLPIYRVRVYESSSTWAEVGVPTLEYAEKFDRSAQEAKAATPQSDVQIGPEAERIARATR